MKDNYLIMYLSIDYKYFSLITIKWPITTGRHYYIFFRSFRKIYMIDSFLKRQLHQLSVGMLQILHAVIDILRPMRKIPLIINTAPASVLAFRTPWMQ